MRGRRRRRGAGSCRRALNPPVGLIDVGVNDEPCVPQTRTRKGSHEWNEELSQPPSEQEGPEEDKPPPGLRQHWTTRPRNIRFSYAENMTLVSKLVPVYEQLLGRKKFHMPRFKKTQMWQDICDAVNRVGRRQRFIHHCKKRFHDIKKQLRTKLNREKHPTAADQQGSPPCHIWYTQYEEELKKVLPAEVIDGIEFFDSDQPQDPSMEQEAGPSGNLTPRNQDQQKQDSLLSDAEFYVSLDSETEESPVDYRVRHKRLQSNPTNTVASTALGPDKPSQDSRTKKNKALTKPREYGFYHLRPQASQSKGLGTALCPVQSPFKPLRSLKAAQCLFRKSVLHNLKVLHWDIGHITHHIDINLEMAKKMLQVETQKNDLLLQMSDNIDRLAESIQQLANQRQAKQVLLCDLLQGKDQNKI
ncbi:uncharacterized protein PAF06_004237 [Gastrophryne carolinensis]